MWRSRYMIFRAPARVKAKDQLVDAFEKHYGNSRRPKALRLRLLVIFRASVSAMIQPR
jgi:hypothetical protein